ncbi:MAG: hypothetical protein KIT68_12125 [Phycisphaeraceae bacterium]|nr:hypothetical protein [Phycisphaeraceae bacterium]
MPLLILSFHQQLPGMDDFIEVFRGCTSIEHAKRVVDLLARSLNYYPTKEQATRH